MSRTVVIITGASSGMGREFALQLDARLRKTDEIWLIARRRERLEELSKKMRNKTRILTMDITKEAQVERLADTLLDKDVVVKMLVNCAGFGIIGDFPHMTIDEQLSMVRTNCDALTHVTHTCLPFMRKNSRIINLASSAAFMPQPGFAVYAATKSYVHSFSLALAQELKSKNIYVTSVCPGPVDTEFFDIAESDGNGTLAIKKIFMAKAPNVVKKALFDACHKKTKSVYSLPMQAFDVLCKLIPHNILLTIVRFIKE